MRSRQDDRSTGPWRSGVGALLLGALVPLLMAGCSDLTAGGLADADVVLSGDAPESGAAASATELTTFEAAGNGDAATGTDGSAAAGQPLGDVTVTLEVSVLSPDERWIDLTGGLQEATVDISGRTEATLSSQELDPGIYSRARVRFTEVTATVESGGPVSGDVSVDFGQEGELVIEEQLELDLQEGESVEIVLDMNTTQWLNAAGPALPVVAERHLRRAFDVRVR